MTMKKHILICVGIVMVLLVGATGVLWGMSHPMQNTAYAADPNAQAWSPSAELATQESTGIHIPGYGEIFFPEGEQDVSITLYNPQKNDCILVYSLYLNDETEPIYTSGGIEPGKAVQQISLSHALEAGEYTLKLHITPYDPQTGSMLNQADVSAPLLVG